MRHLPYSTPRNFFSLAAVVAFAAVLAGCAASSPDDPCKHAVYDGKTGMTAYDDTVHKFHLCLPNGLTKQSPAGLPAGSVVFSGFAVPSGTNLISKTLVIVAGAYDELQGATMPLGQFTAGGVTFKRVTVDEGSAGHSTLHVIYTWKTKGQPVHFDFTHYAVNPGVFDPGQQPPVYNRAAQIKLTEEIMGTFTRLP